MTFYDPQEIYRLRLMQITKNGYPKLLETIYDKITNTLYDDIFTVVPETDGVLVTTNPTTDLINIKCLGFWCKHLSNLNILTKDEQVITKLIYIPFDIDFNYDQYITQIKQKLSDHELLSYFTIIKSASNKIHLYLKLDPPQLSDENLEKTIIKIKMLQQYVSLVLEETGVKVDPTSRYLNKQFWFEFKPTKIKSGISTLITEAKASLDINYYISNHQFLSKNLLFVYDLIFNKQKTIKSNDYFLPEIFKLNVLPTPAEQVNPLYTTALKQYFDKKQDTIKIKKQKKSTKSTTIKTNFYIKKQMLNYILDLEHKNNATTVLATIKRNQAKRSLTELKKQRNKPFYNYKKEFRLQRTIEKPILFSLPNILENQACLTSPFYQSLTIKNKAIRDLFYLCYAPIFLKRSFDNMSRYKDTYFRSTKTKLRWNNVIRPAIETVKFAFNNFYELAGTYIKQFYSKAELDNLYPDIIKAVNYVHNLSTHQLKTFRQKDNTLRKILNKQNSFTVNLAILMDGIIKNKIPYTIKRNHYYITKKDIKKFFKSQNIPIKYYFFKKLEELDLLDAEIITKRQLKQTLKIYQAKLDSAKTTEEQIKLHNKVISYKKKLKKHKSDYIIIRNLITPSFIFYLDISGRLPVFNGALIDTYNVLKKQDRKYTHIITTNVNLYTINKFNTLFNKIIYKYRPFSVKDQKGNLAITTNPILTTIRKIILASYSIHKKTAKKMTLLSLMFNLKEKIINTWEYYHFKFNNRNIYQTYTNNFKLNFYIFKQYSMTKEKYDKIKHQLNDLTKYINTKYKSLWVVFQLALTHKVKLLNKITISDYIFKWKYFLQRLSPFNFIKTLLI